MAGRPRVEIDPALLASGLPAGEIAAQLGCSTTTVLNRQRDAGISTRGRGQRGPGRGQRGPDPDKLPPNGSAHDGTRHGRSRMVECDETLIAEVESLVQLGVPPITAVLAQGVDEETFAQWWTQGASPDAGEFTKLRAAIRKAEARCEAVLVGRVREASAKSWQAAAWLAERRFPENYVRRSVADRGEPAGGEPASDPFSELDSADVVSIAAKRKSSA